MAECPPRMNGVLCKALNWITLGQVVCWQARVILGLLALAWAFEIASRATR